MKEEALKIVLVDDHTMMREGTRRLLEEDPALCVVGEAHDGESAIDCCQKLHPDVVVLDISMKGMNGFHVARWLKEQAQPTAILVLTAYDQLSYVHTMLKLGVKGYWLKSARSSEIRQAVHEVAHGRLTLDPAVRQLLAESEEEPPRLVEPLTTRELAVLRFVVQGARNIEIAQRLAVSVKTVEAHLTSIYGKLGVQSRAEAIALAQRQGLLLDEHISLS